MFKFFIQHWICLLCLFVSSSAKVFVVDEDSLRDSIADNASVVMAAHISLNMNITISGVSSFMISSSDYTISGEGKVSCFFIVDSSVLFENITFANGLGRYGGALAMYSSDVTISGCTFHSNRAILHGAGAYMYGGTLRLSMCHFHDNIAKVNGAGVYARVSNLTLDQCFMGSNVARDGGGCYTHAGYAQLINCTIANNSALAYGGGYCSRYSLVQISHNTVYNNTAKIDGGGIYIDDGTAHIISTELFHNLAGVHGGGMYLYDCFADVSHSNFHNNEMKEGYGGGLYILFATQANLTSLLFTNNSAYKGGGLLIDGSTSSTNVRSYNCEFYYNTATFGGGTYIYDGINTLVNSTYRENYAISPMFKVRQNASCHSTVVGGCIYSSNFPRNYDDDEYCEFEALSDGVTDVLTFQTEADYDFVYIEGKAYSGSIGPDGVDMSAGDIITWISDGSLNKEGFEICFTHLGGGGGLYVEGGVINLVDSVIATNEATQYGGGVYIEGGSNLFTNIDIHESIAATKGVELYFSGGTFEAIELHIENYNKYSLSGYSAGAASCFSDCKLGQSGSCESYSSASLCYVNCECDICPAGKFSSSKGSTTIDDCEECSAGSYSDGSSACTACTAGKYATTNSSDTDGGQSNPVYSGAAVCNDCPAGYISTSIGSFVCQACQSPSTSSSGGTQCDQAIEGYYFLKGSTNECVDGTVCYGGYMVPVPEYGYWIDRTNFTYLDVPYKCQRKTCKVAKSLLNSSCFTEQGYFNSHCNSDKLMCRKGSRGPLCQSCNVDYKYEAQKQKCVECTTSLSSYISTIVFTVLIVVLLLMIAFGVLRIPRKLAKTFFMSMIYILKNNGSLTILFSTYQIIQSIPISMQVHYPSPFDTTLNWLIFLEFDFEGFECAGIGVMDRVYIVSLIPFIFVIISVIVGQIRILIASRMADESRRKDKVNHIFSQHAWFTIFLSYLVLPPVLNKQLKALDCFSFYSGESYLRIDTSVNCSSDQYKQFRVFDTLMICTYASMPFIWVILLYRRRDLLFPQNVPREFIAEKRRLNESLSYLGFLYERYRPEMAYWEAGDMFRRVFFVGLIPLMAPSTILRAALGIFCSLLSTFIYREWMPYDTPGTNRLSYVANISIFVMYASSMMIEDGISEDFNQLAFGLVLCGVNFATILFAFGAAYVKTKRDRLLIMKRRESLMKQVEMACSFTVKDFENIVDIVTHSVLPPGHVLVYFYGSLRTIHKVLRQGIHIKKQHKPVVSSSSSLSSRLRSSSSSTCEEGKMAWEDSDSDEGIIFTSHLPHQLTAGEKAVFNSMEAVVMISLPQRSLSPYRSTSNYSRGSVSDPSDLWWLSSKILHAMKTSYFEGVLDRKPWKNGVLFCPPHCVLRAFQIEEVNVEVDLQKSFKGAENFNVLNQFRNGNSTVSCDIATESFSDQLDDGGRSHDSNLQDEHGIELKYLNSNQGNRPQLVYDVVEKASIKESFQIEDIKTYITQMNIIRQRCYEHGLVPVYHFTSPQIVSLILKNGFRMTEEGLGGSVHFSTEGPSCYGLGGSQYEENLILDFYGEERLHEYQNRHMFDSCIVYGIEPLVLKRVPRAGSRRNFVVVPRMFFESFSLPRSDGYYFLRPDRIFGVFDINSQCPPDGLDQKVLDTEVSLDEEAQQRIAALEEKGVNGTAKVNDAIV